MDSEKFGTIGYWSELKLDILSEYAKPYSTILRNQPGLYHIYVDAFAGAGVHLSRSTGAPIPGSPLRVLQIAPRFREYHFIDLDGKKVDSLRQLIGPREDVHLHAGDCNRILLEEVFPRARFQDYRRALCLLDPYGIHLKWEVLQTAGQMRSIEIFLNFMVMDMNRNVLWRQPDRVHPAQIERMNAFWPDWREAAYRKVGGLFGDEDEKVRNEAIAAAFQKRLKDVAGFRYVPDPIPMRNSTGSVIYYLFFASQKEAGEKIAKDIFKKYRARGTTP